ncbi:MAG TPA: DJ-1/PfpI family protein [Bryobacteraceae bacterium]|nr:DJ-1/PfpI family protein [Bryobacteraceae bacterium]
MPSIAEETHLHIGAIAYPRMDQMDLTGPFEVLSRLPNSSFHILWKDTTPFHDARGLTLAADQTFEEAPALDVLVVPGGPGQQDLMEEEVVLGFLRMQAENARYVLSVCTGALLCGAAGLLRGVRATTHWTARSVIPWFGAIPVNERVVIDGKIITTAGVSAGIDGALRLAALLRGDQAAQQIQLYMEYAPEPPFTAGTPETAPAEVLIAARAAARRLTEARFETARHLAQGAAAK